jgi:hypothetical protein
MITNFTKEQEWTYVAKLDNKKKHLEEIGAGATLTPRVCYEIQEECGVHNQR